MSCANRSQDGTDDEKSLSNAVKTDVTPALAPERNIQSFEDISDRSKRILETLERAIEAYTQARIHLSNVDVEEAKIAEANHTQESIAREMLAQGDQFLDVIRADPRHELGLDALSDLALKHIQGYNKGLETMDSKCDRLESDIAEVTRLIKCCQTVDANESKGVTTPPSADQSTRISSLRKQCQAKQICRLENSHHSNKIRRRATVSQSSESASSASIVRRSAGGQREQRKLILPSINQAVARHQPMALLRSPQSIGEIFNYVIAQK